MVRLVSGFAVSVPPVRRTVPTASSSVSAWAPLTPKPMLMSPLVVVSVVSPTSVSSPLAVKVEVKLCVPDSVPLETAIDWLPVVKIDGRLAVAAVRVKLSSATLPPTVLSSSTLPEVADSVSDWTPAVLLSIVPATWIEPPDEVSDVFADSTTRSR